MFEQTGLVQRSVAPQTPEEQQLAALQAELVAVLGVYADDTPRVKALRNRIASAQKAVEAQAPAPSATDAEGETGNMMLDVNLSQIDSRIAMTERELGQANEELVRLKAAIDATATNSITLGALERDQANIQARYNAAVASLGEARTAERIETCLLYNI